MQVQRDAVTLCVGLDAALVFAVGDAVADGIFDDGLKQEAGDQATQRAWFHLDLDVEPIGEADLFNREIVLHHLDLLREWDLLRRGSF